MGSVRRFVGAAVVVVISLLGWMMPGPAAATPVLPSASYTYDSALSSVPNKGVHHERGPLLSQPVANARHAVDRGPHGISARPDSSETGRGYTYDDRATPAQAAQSIGGAQVKPTMARGIASLPQRLPVAAKAGTNALRSVDDVLAGLPQGNQSWVRMVPDEGALTTKFDELTVGGKPTTWKNFDGTVIERGDGVQVGMRSYSGSGGGAIDVRMPDGSRIRIHVERP